MMDVPLLRALAPAMCAGIGGFSAVMGFGGGTLGMPALNMFGAPIRSAVATSSAFGLVIALPAKLGAEGRPPVSAGWVSLMGFVLIAPAWISATPWGVALAHSLSPLLLRRAFAPFRALTSLRMGWSLPG